MNMRTTLKFASVMLTFIVILGIVLYAASAQTDKNTMIHTSSQGELSDKVLRLHILAQSNSQYDQIIKMKVKDLVTSKYALKFASFDDKREALGWLEQNKDEIENAVNLFLKKENISYTANAQVLRCAFPDKQYDSVIFPSGEYDALRISLGEAKGNNWWCVLYPPLCFINVYEDELAVEDELDPAQGDEKLQIRWKFLELFD